MTEMEEVQNEMSSAYTQGVVDGFSKEILDPTFLRVHPYIIIIYHLSITLVYHSKISMAIIS